MAISVTKPTVGGSEDTWGTTINASLDTIVDGINGDAGTISPDLSTLTINGTDVTATAAELNYMDGATANTVVNSKAVVYGSAGEVAATTVTATTVGATTVDLGDWTISQVGSDLKFAYNGTNRFKLSSTGALTVEGNVTGFGGA